MAVFLKPIYVVEIPDNPQIYLQRIMLSPRLVLDSIMNPGIFKVPGAEIPFLHFPPEGKDGHGKKFLFSRFREEAFRNESNAENKIHVQMAVYILDPFLNPNTELRLHVFPYFGFEATADQIEKYRKNPSSIFALKNVTIDNITKMEVIKCKDVEVSVDPEKPDGYAEFEEVNFKLPVKKFLKKATDLSPEEKAVLARK